MSGFCNKNVLIIGDENTAVSRTIAMLVKNEMEKKRIIVYESDGAIADSAIGNGAIAVCRGFIPDAVKGANVCIIEYGEKYQNDILTDFGEEIPPIGALLHETAKKIPSFAQMFVISDWDSFVMQNKANSNDVMKIMTMSRIPVIIGNRSAESMPLTVLGHTPNKILLSLDKNNITAKAFGITAGMADLLTVKEAVLWQTGDSGDWTKTSEQQLERELYHISAEAQVDSFIRRASGNWLV